MGSRTTTTSSTRTFQSSKVPVEEPKPPRQQRTWRMPKLRFSPWILVIILLLISGFLVIQYHQARTKLQKTAPAAATRQLNDVVSRVGKLIILPKDEQPSTLATVSDADKLKSQAFFVDAKNGDKVLIYSKQRRAILYRPSTNQLVNVAPATIANGSVTSLTPN